MTTRARPEPGPVYAIADAAALAPTPLPAAVEEIAAAGIRWIQIRAKEVPDRELYSQVEACCRRLEGSGAALWIDDRPDVAALFPVAGVHLGQRDLPPAAARRVVGEGLWIGSSTHDDGELEAAVDDPEVDVVAVGPVFPTTGKEAPEPVVGLPFVRRARRKTTKTLVAIGGIGPGNLRQVLDAGADAVAVLGAVCRGDLTTNLSLLAAALEGTG